MIEVEITKDMLTEADEKAKDLGVLNRSIMKGSRNKIGFLGERIARDVLKAKYANVKEVNYDYDLVMPKTGITIDVKSKQTSVPPQPHYECGVMDYNSSTQKCDYYAFVRIDKKLDRGWFLGVKSKLDYILQATFIPKGTIDKRNDFEQKTDSYNLEISKLDSEILPRSIPADFLVKVLNSKIKKIEEQEEKLYIDKFQIELLDNMRSWATNNFKI